LGLPLKAFKGKADLTAFKGTFLFIWLKFGPNPFDLQSGKAFESVTRMQDSGSDHGRQIACFFPLIGMEL
jgi:hypothetical protein